MKKLFSVILTIFLLSATLVGVGCSSEQTITSKSINLNRYFDKKVQVLTDGGNVASTEVETFTKSEDHLFHRYNEMLFTGKPKWTYALYVEALSFELVSTENTDFSINVYFNNLSQSDNTLYNQEGQWYRSFSFLTSTLANTPSKIFLEINEQFTRGDSSIKIVVDKVHTLATYPNMKYYISNLEIVGCHK